MEAASRFTFPRREHIDELKKRIAEINGRGSFSPAQKSGEGVWSAEIHCSRGPVFEKAGCAMVEMRGGRVEDASADISLLQALVWPAAPCIPGLIIMASTSQVEDQNVIVTFYADLIIQDGAPRPEDKAVFSAALKAACEKHGQSLEEYQAFLAGRGMLGGCAAECGLLYFFEESDAALLSDIMLHSLEAYSKIIAGAADRPAEAAGTAKMQELRKNIINWMLTEDYGMKISRQNNIPLEVTEAYAFPPLQKN